MQAVKNHLYKILNLEFRQDLIKNSDKYIVKYNYYLLTLFCNLTDQKNMGKLFIQNLIFKDQLKNLLK